ncbi:MAG: aspartate--tRNA ligase [Ndongobacter sp.]|nr:aspartate--tRNA ligase [Ndongobacter sp.]
MDHMTNLRRTHYCGALRKEHIGSRVVLMGWAQKTRNLGSLEFIDLRDREGIAQLVFNQETSGDLYEKSKTVRQEYVLAVSGIVVERESKNSNLPTGDVEVLCDDLRILNTAKTPPIYIRDDDPVQEALRLKYRYLDLRKPGMQKRLKDRAEITRAFREFLHDNGFIEVETPFLGKPTPEGARDYLVPSRINANQFYALPQSPQLMKQLLMIGGTDRYYQVARCFRDEDLRANRQPEFTQVDIEMSFVDMEDVIDLNERLMCHVFREYKGIELKRPFPRISYDEAMARFGSDKPDLRYGFEICEMTEIVRAHGLFADEIASGERIYAINFEQLATAYSRKKLDKLASYAKGIGAKNLLWLKKEAGQLTSSFNKWLTEELAKALDEALTLNDGDLALFMLGEPDKTLERMGSLRTTLAAEHLTLDPNEFAITWVIDFPMFEYSEEEKRYVAKHHPFTSPKDEDIELLETAPEKVRAKAYDIVINGDERGGGSIRINDSALQDRVFRLLQLSEEEIESRFGFFTQALSYGTPPHGGIAYGLDRFIMMLTETDNIKDVIAFPKTQSATDLLMEAPTNVTEEQLSELHIRLR